MLSQEFVLFLLAVLAIIINCYSYYRSGYAKGYINGAVDLLANLEKRNVIFIEENGSIRRVNDAGEPSEILHKP